MSVLSGIEADLVAQLSSEIAYLGSPPGTCRGVADIATAMDLVVTPPATLIEYAGETANPPLALTVARQLSRLNWDIFCIAQSFSASGGGRIDDGTEKGAYTILDDIFDALEGFMPPSQQTIYATRLFFVGAARYTLTEAAVIYVSRWYCDVLRQQA